MARQRLVEADAHVMGLFQRLEYLAAKHSVAAEDKNSHQTGRFFVFIFRCRLDKQQQRSTDGNTQDQGCSIAVLFTGSNADMQATHLPA